MLYNILKGILIGLGAAAVVAAGIGLIAAFSLWIGHDDNDPTNNQPGLQT